MLATWVPAKARNLDWSAFFGNLRVSAHRKRKVPTNSPNIAIISLRIAAGMALKVGEALGGDIFSCSALEVEVFVFERGVVVRPRSKRPGRKPLLASSLSMMGEDGLLLLHHSSGMPPAPE